MAGTNDNVSCYLCLKVELSFHSANVVNFAETAKCWRTFFSTTALRVDRQAGLEPVYRQRGRGHGPLPCWLSVMLLSFYLLLSLASRPVEVGVYAVGHHLLVVGGVEHPLDVLTRWVAALDDSLAVVVAKNSQADAFLLFGGVQHYRQETVQRLVFPEFVSALLELVQEMAALAGVVQVEADAHQPPHEPDEADVGDEHLGAYALVHLAAGGIPPDDNREHDRHGVELPTLQLHEQFEKHRCADEDADDDEDFFADGIYQAVQGSVEESGEHSCQETAHIETN